ncbi:MAG TPA: hypothetical protein VK158_01560 [Acidobacteriota bacterium]|nr:hypothetical protein [Acidobacteriota bacterium]
MTVSVDAPPTVSVASRIIPKSKTAVGLDKIIVQLREGSELYITVREQVVSEKIFAPLGTARATFESEERFTAVIRRLMDYIHFSNSQSQHKIGLVYEQSAFRASYRIDQFLTYTIPLKNEWIKYITDGLPVRPEHQIKPIQPPYKF